LGRNNSKNNVDGRERGGGGNAKRLLVKKRT